MPGLIGQESKLGRWAAANPWRYAAASAAVIYVTFAATSLIIWHEELILIDVLWPVPVAVLVFVGVGVLLNRKNKGPAD